MYSITEASLQPKNSATRGKFATKIFLPPTCIFFYARMHIKHSLYMKLYDKLLICLKNVLIKKLLSYYQNCHHFFVWVLNQFNITFKEKTIGKFYDKRFIHRLHLWKFMIGVFILRMSTRMANYPAQQNCFNLNWGLLVGRIK